MKRIFLAAGIGLLLLVGSAIFYSIERGGEKVLTIYGNVDIRQANLGFRVPGRILKMLLDEGDQVLPGDLMAQLDSVPYEEEVAQAQAKVASLEAALKQAEAVLERRKPTVLTGAVSKENYDDAYFTFEQVKANHAEAVGVLESALTRLEDTRILTPSAGSILTRVQEPGVVVSAGQPVYSLSIASPVWIRTYVAEPDLGRIYAGMPAEVYTDTKNVPVYKGRIGFISPVAEFTPKSVETTSLRTDLVYRLRVVIDDPDPYLKQGMPVTVKIPSQGR